MFSYYGIAAGFILSVVNYFILGLALSVDDYYLALVRGLVGMYFRLSWPGNVALPSSSTASDFEAF
jgi:hypothetical protein